ncbi:hypothetical protein [Hungatella hathewayi]|uniref:hypothetical protein n=1 Tax=Hungatella hathewayi TaxID=154046 RepID=UPI003562D5C9
MDKKKCILKSGNGYGSRIFYYENPESEYETFNKEVVKIFDRTDAERPFQICHRNQIVAVPDSVGIEQICGMSYPEWRWFHSVKEEWHQH